MTKKILLLSAYDTSSHHYWRDQLANMFSAYEWTQRALPARHFSWRIRGNSLSWGFDEADSFREDYDLLIATSMVDLSSLRGFIPKLATLPTLVYFHENQFAYPMGTVSNKNAEQQLVPIYSALCADAICFNSNYNRTTFLEGARSLFKQLPDLVPKNLSSHLEASTALPVPIDVPDKNERVSAADHLSVVWNHRWEYDKGPGILLEIIRQIAKEELPIRFHILGEQFRQWPAEFDQIQELLESHCQRTGLAAGHFGFIDNKEQYFACLQQSDVVLSTALHEFQGVAMQEAILCGCTPLAPARLVYPEYLEPQFLFPAAETAEAEAAAADILRTWLELRRSGTTLPQADLQSYSSNNLQDRYAALFARLLQGR
ncbi:MAG: glycosyl transferase family 1 [Gammaproteobacteria bacterium]|nr:glycosyl transferase family 1 [Gammaproteobacteria bacterium]